MTTPKNFVTTIERITPARAEELLERNNSNRKMRNNRVNTYALLMQAGLWHADSNDAILVADDGEVINGQHRLSAVVVAGVPVDMAIRYGVNKSMYDSLDQGLNRTAGDFIDDFANKKIIMTCAKFIAALKHGSTSLAMAINGKMTDNAVIPHEWVAEEIKSNFDLYQRCAANGIRFRSKIVNGSMAGIMDAFMLAEYVGRGYGIDEFVDEFCAVLPTSYTVAALKDTLIDRNNKGFKISPKDMIAFILYGYDKYMAGETVKTYKISNAAKTLREYEELARFKYKSKVGA